MSVATIKVKLLYIGYNYYTQLVFERLIYRNELDRYIMVTLLPNWQTEEIELGDIGYLTYKEAIGGESYYNHHEDEYYTYKYSNLYFQVFLKESNNELGNKIIERTKLNETCNL